MHTTLVLSEPKDSTFKQFASELLLIIAGSLLLAGAARVAIPLPGTHVPITLQTLAALYLGFKFGPIRSFMAVMCYLCESSYGLPVLNGGSVNPMAAIGLNAGYLWGMALEASLIGYFAEKLERSSLVLLLGTLFSAFLQLAMGTLWLSTFVGFQLAIQLGFLPFIGVELVKAVLLINSQRVISLDRI